MSEAGVTVHEANLEEDQITFSGFPWLLRLRYIMENARNSQVGRLPLSRAVLSGLRGPSLIFWASALQDVRALWAATNNTVGFNFMASSAADAAAYAQGGYTGPGVAPVMETRVCGRQGEETRVLA